MTATRKARLLSSIGIALACATSACYEPNLKDCVIACGTRNECPADLTCHGGFCSSGVECKPDGPRGDRDLGDLVSDRSQGSTSFDGHPSEVADGRADARSDATEAPTDASAADLTEDASWEDGGEPSDMKDAASDADTAGTDANDAESAGGTDLPGEAPTRCPPGIRVSTRTGRCLPMNDFDGDGRADGIAGNDSGTDALISDGFRFHRVNNWISGGAWYSIVPSFHGVLTGDVNGDRITDVVTFAPGWVTALILPGTGTGMYYDFDPTWSTVPLHGQYFTYLADVSGDGKDDVIALNQGEVDVALSTGFNFAAPTTWFAADLRGYNGAYFADVDGDYCADAITISPSSVDVRLSTKASFKEANSWLTVDVAAGDVIHIADADGDGLADYIRVRPDATSVALSDGHTFGTLETWHSGALAGSANTFFVDVDGDGRADVVAVNATSVDVALSTGTGFASPTTWYDGEFAGTYWTSFAFEPAGSHSVP